MIIKDSNSQMKLGHKRITSLPNFKNTELPSISKTRQSQSRKVLKNTILPPSPAKKVINCKTVEKISISPLISMGMTSFSMLKFPKTVKKSDFLLEVLASNAENREKYKKITINPPHNASDCLKRQKNFALKQPIKNIEQIEHNRSSEIQCGSRFSVSEFGLGNLTHNEIFSVNGGSKNLYMDDVPYAERKNVVVKPRYSKFIFNL